MPKETPNPLFPFRLCCVFVRAALALTFVLGGHVIATAQGGALQRPTKRKDTVQTSTPTYNLLGVKVEARREQKPGTNPGTVTIKLDEPVPSSRVTVADIIATSPSAFVRDYGGLGGIKTVSLRGLSAQQTLVLVDGVRVNSSQNGLADLSLLSPRMFEEMSITRGGASSVYGSNAAGGVIELNSAIPKARREVRAECGAGSFGEYTASLHVGGRTEQGSLSAGAEYQRSAGDFPFALNQFGTNTELSRSNGDATLAVGRLHVHSDFGRVALRSSAYLSHSNRGAPGAVIQGGPEFTQARLKENKLLLVNSLISATEPGRKVSLIFQGNHLRFTDPNFTPRGPMGADDKYSSIDWGLHAMTPVVFGDTELHAGIEAWSNELVGSYLNSVSGDSVSRQSLAPCAHVRQAVETDSHQVEFNASTRFDWFSDVSHALSGSLGCVYSNLAADLSVYASVSRNFRAPTFNEMYYLNFGNRDLRPEKSLNISLGLAQQFGRVKLGIEGYRVQTDSMIVSVPLSAAIWSARNLGTALSQGVEFQFEGTITSALGLNASLTVQSVVDRSVGSLNNGFPIPYTPALLGSAALAYRIGAVSMVSHVQYVGRRYSLPEPIADNALPGYLVVNVVGHWVWNEQALSSPRVRVRGEVLNVFGQAYQVLAGFPMPGRQIRAGMHVDI